MAKNAKTVEKPAASFTFGDFTVSADALTPAMLYGLAGLGFSTKLKNVTAGLKPAIMGESKGSNWEPKDFAEAAKEMGREYAEGNESDKAWREDFASAYAAFVVKSEYDAILAGTASFGSARGPRLKGLEWYIREVAKVMWPKVKAKVEGVTKENEADKFFAFVEKNRAVFLPEAERRMAEDQKAEGELELDL